MHIMSQKSIFIYIFGDVKYVLNTCYIKTIDLENVRCFTTEERCAEYVVMCHLSS
jgi:hypothetical protein